MKILGLLGGMSWESTTSYYQIINRRVRQVKGGLHSAPCIIYSFDFAEVEELQRNEKWDAAGALLNQASAKLKLAGAEAVAVCTNTMHLVAGGVEEACGLPLLHIVDATAEAVVKAGHKSVGLLGTKFTMERDFFKARLADKYGLTVVVPKDEGRERVHSIIYNELCNGVIRHESRNEFQGVIEELGNEGAECVILGCTEIGLLIDAESIALPMFDTTAIHATALADWAMSE